MNLSTYHGPYTSYMHMLIEYEVCNKSEITITITEPGPLDDDLACGCFVSSDTVMDEGERSC